MNAIDEHSLEDHKLWRLVTETWESLSEKFEPKVETQARASGFTRRIWSLLLATMTCEPDPISSADLMVRNPFIAAETFSRCLNEAAAKGFLVELEPGSFRLSEVGRKETQRLIDLAREVMIEANPLPDQDGERLAKLLGRLVKFCLETPPPPSTWAIQASYNLMPPENPPIPNIEQSMTCLAAYRDDSHLAAWRFTNLSATALESLSYLWRHEANSLDELCEKLASRGYPRKTYERALTDLYERDFIDSPAGSLQVSNLGRLFRNEVEEDTNRFFFAPWKNLSYLEKTDMAGLLIRLKQGLQVQTHPKDIYR